MSMRKVKLLYKQLLTLLVSPRACYKNEISVEVTSEAEEACSSLFFHPYILKCHDTVSYAVLAKIR